MIHILICWYSRSASFWSRDRPGSSKHIIIIINITSYQKACLPSGPVISAACLPDLQSLLQRDAPHARLNQSAVTSLALSRGAVTDSVMAEAWLMNINEAAWRARYAIGCEAGVCFLSGRGHIREGLLSATSSQRSINIYYSEVKGAHELNSCLLFQSHSFGPCL